MPVAAELSETFDRPGLRTGTSAPPASPIRYMGTKRHLAPTVRAAIDSVNEAGHVADLFTGMGSVASALAPTHPVIANDAFEFAGAFARARFTDRPSSSSTVVARNLIRQYSECRAALVASFRRRLAQESAAMEGGPNTLRAYMETAPHVATSRHYSARSQAAQSAASGERYCLTTLYFSAGYFSTAQSIQLDALRFGIDTSADEYLRDWLLAAWLATAGTVINAPGHTAQYLKPNNDAIHRRVVRQWSRPIWETFLAKLDEIAPVGTRAWRQCNRVVQSDALELLGSEELGDAAVIYADPPYTKDQYSRYYHVYETLYRYDFPDSSGAGRYPSRRFETGFCRVREVRSAFESLCRLVATAGKTLVLSYPGNGLLYRAGVDLVDLLDEYFSIAQSTSLAARHSTLGASSGAASKDAIEHIYVCIPR